MLHAAYDYFIDPMLAGLGPDASEAQSVAMIDDFHALALAGAVCNAVALGVFLDARRRDRLRTGAAS